jgi:4-phytase / acid phosphatase
MNSFYTALLRTFVAMLSVWAPLIAQQRPVSLGELKYVVIVCRHGLRPPLWTDTRLNQYSSQPWPKWGVPTGNLTDHGRTLIRLLGAYERAQFTKAGLFSPKACEDAHRIYIWTDTDDRTIATGKALVEGMMPHCNLPVQSLAPGTADPIFSPVKAGIGHPDRYMAASAISGRIGGHPEALAQAYRSALEIMDQVLLGCKHGPNCPPPGKTSLLDLPAAVVVGQGDHAAELSGPLPIASALAQDLLLEYANGMQGKDLGWGRLNETNLRQILALHIVYSDLARRTPYIGRMQASNMLSHILKSIEQAVSGRLVAGALGKPGDRLLVLVGHDGNLSNISGTLDLSWLLPGDLPNDTPPGGALIFNLWRRPAVGDYFVTTYYMAQTPEQLRKALPLTLDSPPAIAPVFVPGCSQAAPLMPCTWNAFRQTVENKLDASMVK